VSWLHEQQTEYKNTVRFLAVYITEAHARNEWPVGRTISFCDQPTTVEERISLAKTFINKHNYQVPMLVDQIANEFQDKFAAWPFRFFVANNGRVVHKAEPNARNFSYDITELGIVLQGILEYGQGR